MTNTNNTTVNDENINPMRAAVSRRTLMKGSVGGLSLIHI